MHDSIDFSFPFFSFLFFSFLFFSFLFFSFLFLLPLSVPAFDRNLRIAEMEHQVAPRPMSRERPAMEGFSQGLLPEMSSQSEVMST